MSKETKAYHNCPNCRTSYKKHLIKCKDCGTICCNVCSDGTGLCIDCVVTRSSNKYINDYKIKGVVKI